MYRLLTNHEIGILESKSCYCDNWQNVLVHNNFDPTRYSRCRFSGKIKLGEQTDEISLPGGVKNKCGIYNAHIHNCTIGNNVYISNIQSYIANYTIEDNAIITDVSIIAVDGICSFGNGLKIKVLDETGGRTVNIYDNLSAHLAYIMAFYKHRTEVVQALENMIETYTESVRSTTGIIGFNSRITNCGTIINVKIGPHTIAEGVNKMENGSVNGNERAPVKLGSSIILKNFIISSGSEITDGVIIDNCFIGQGCTLGAQYSAQQSLFFSNCQGFHGEACSTFAGPYTVTHHKSTLLIAGMFSFCNAGSGSNQSNHMYKLGPIHHGVVERGSKTTSDSYILWPAKIGAFTLVMGRHYKNSDTSNMPFSYMIENDDDTWLIPGVNLKSVGTIRDVMKWPKRDKRTDNLKIDRINFNLLSPFTIQKMHTGIKTLRKIQRISGETTYTFSYNNTKIKSSALKRGIELYNMAIMKFIGNSVITRLNHQPLGSLENIKHYLTPQNKIGEGNWIDLAGLLVPKSEIKKLLKDIKNGNINKLDQIESIFNELHDNYYEYEWTWTAKFIEGYLGKPITSFSVEEITKLVENWRKCILSIDNMLYEDARKEYKIDLMIGFGIDGNEQTQQKDFEQVRGKFEENDFVKEIQNHMIKKNKLGDRVIAQLSEVIDN